MINAHKILQLVSKAYTLYIEPILFCIKKQTAIKNFGISDRAVIPVAEINFGYRSGECSEKCRRLVNRYTRYFCKYNFRWAENSYRYSPFLGTPALIDLREFDSFVNYEAVIRRRSGGFWRNAKKARRYGCFSKKINERNHYPDICNIRKSKTFRSFGIVMDVFFLNVESMGGYPNIKLPLEKTICPLHWKLSWGVFVNSAGHYQGSVPMNERLVGYITLHRIGNVVRYSDIMGHADYLNKGVITMLHMDLMKWFYEDGGALSEGIEFIFYGAVEQGDVGLSFWKRKAQFFPHNLKVRIVN